VSEREELVAILGDANVSDTPEALEAYSKDESFVRSVKPQFVARPQNVYEVQEVVKWANSTGTPLVPVSSGPPHFKGDTIPALGSVIVDLRRMNRILRIDRRNRVAMVEPGVTFSNLKPEIEKQGMRLMTPLAPRVTKSVIASYLEREPILVPKYHWDMSDPLGCVEVIFGKGDLFRTGAAAGPGTLEEQWKSGQAQKNPLGPSQSDLFRVVQGAQGTRGIVTWATIRLELLPSIQELYMVGCENVNEIIDFAYWIQRLKLVDECLVLDRLNLASILEQDSESIEKLSAKLPPYVLIYVVAGYDRFPEERVDYQSKDMKEIAQRNGIKPITALAGVNSTKLLKALSEPCPEPFWKLRYRGNSADIFFLTTLDRSPDFIQVMRETANETGFPATSIGSYIQPVQQGRSCHVEFNLTYDSTSQAERALAGVTFDRASKAMMNQGAFFSRPYGTWPEMIRDQYAENVAALRKIKKIFDPNDVMNPGKLFF
jgi:FAD/FMN-containing dehydrogenase